MSAIGEDHALSRLAAVQEQSATPYLVSPLKIIPKDSWSGKAGRVWTLPGLEWRLPGTILPSPRTLQRRGEGGASLSPQLRGECGSMAPLTLCVIRYLRACSRRR